MVYQQIQEGVAATAGTDPNGRLTRKGLTSWIDALSADDKEVLGSVRSALESVKGGSGKPLASLLAIFGDLFLGLIKSIVVPLVFVAVFGRDGNGFIDE